MARNRAPIPDETEIENLISRMKLRSFFVEEDVVIFRLSFLAGLRIREIAGLEWSRHILKEDGTFRTITNTHKNGGKVRQEHVPAIQITSDIGKYGNERVIPARPELCKALAALHKTRAEGCNMPWVILPRKRGAGTDLNSRAVALRVRVNRMYKQVFECGGYTSHLGRRAFITKLAQNHSLFGASLVDVSRMAGHKSVTTTQTYIGPSSGLINAIME